MKCLATFRFTRIFMSENKVVVVDGVSLVFDPVTREEAWRRHTQQKLRYAAWRITRTTPKNHVERRCVADKSLSMLSFMDVEKWAKDWDEGKAIPDGLADAVQDALDANHPGQRAVSADGTRWKSAVSAEAKDGAGPAEAKDDAGPAEAKDGAAAETVIQRPRASEMLISRVRAWLSEAGKVNQ